RDGYRDNRHDYQRSSLATGHYSFINFLIYQECSVQDMVDQDRKMLSSRAIKMKPEKEEKV
ncbi:MAG: hypothetical protein ACREA4_01050, partial [Nitrososphaera sp.]